MVEVVAGMSLAWQSVVDGGGFKFSTTGMIITIASLVVIGVILTKTPVFRKLSYKKSAQEQDLTSGDGELTDDVIAAIGYAHHSYLSGDCVLTSSLMAAIGTAYHAHISGGAPLSDDILAAIGLAHHSVQNGGVGVPDDVVVAVGLSHHFIQTSKT